MALLSHKLHMGSFTPLQIEVAVARLLVVTWLVAGLYALILPTQTKLCQARFVSLREGTVPSIFL